MVSPSRCHEFGPGHRFDAGAAHPCQKGKAMLFLWDHVVRIGERVKTTTQAVHSGKTTTPQSHMQSLSISAKRQMFPSAGRAANSHATHFLRGRTTCLRAAAKNGIPVLRSLSWTMQECRAHDFIALRASQPLPAPARNAKPGPGKMHDVMMSHCQVRVAPHCRDWTRTLEWMWSERPSLNRLIPPETGGNFQEVDFVLQ